MINTGMLYVINPEIMKRQVPTFPIRTYSRIFELMMELNITSAERQSAKALQDLAVSSISLCNDRCHGQKEAAAHINGKSRLLNAVFILMKQHNLPAYQSRGLLQN